MPALVLLTTVLSAMRVVVGLAREEPSVPVSGEPVCLDATAPGGEQDDPGAVGCQSVASHRAQRHPRAGGVDHDDAREEAAGDRQLTQVGLVGTDEEDSGGEVGDRAGTDGDPLVARAVVDPDVTRLVTEAGVLQGAVPVHGVPVEVQGHVVGADHEPVARAPGQVPRQHGAVSQHGTAVRLRSDGGRERPCCDAAAGKGEGCDERQALERSVSMHGEPPGAPGRPRPVLTRRESAGYPQFLGGSARAVDTLITDSSEPDSAAESRVIGQPSCCAD